MSHYFTNDNIKSDEKIIEVKIGGHGYKFYVDNGVFSKRGLDFGTRSLLENLDLENIHGDVLDFGTGYGPIGIYIAHNTQAKVDMIDINKRSLSLAAKNAKLNQIEVNIFESNIYENVTKKYDYIITNPPIRVGKEILYKILFGANDYLNTDGEMWLVVSKDQGAKTLSKKLEEVYDVQIITKNKGFYIIKAKKH